MQIYKQQPVSVMQVSEAKDSRAVGAAAASLQGSAHQDGPSNCTTHPSRFHLGPCHLLVCTLLCICCTV